METIDFSSEAFQTNPWPLYAHLRSYDPIHWSSTNRCFFLVKHKHVRQVLESQDFSVEHPFRASRQVFGPTLLDIDGATHQRLRPLAAQKFKPACVEAYKANIIEPVVHELLDPILDVGHADFISEFAVHVPIRVITRIMGIPVKDSFWLHKQLRPIIQYLDDPRVSLEDATHSRESLEFYLQSIIEQNRNKPTDTVIGRLVSAHILNQGLDQSEILRSTLLLLAAGTETTISAIGNMLACLLMHPDTLASVQENPALIPLIVRETLRWEPPLHTTLRFAANDVEQDGVLIRRGTPVQISLASANRDEDIYVRPDIWNPTRKELGILSFGSGKHSCLGFSLAQKELEIILRIILNRLVNITLQDGVKLCIRGRVFRGLKSLPLYFQARQ